MPLAVMVLLVALLTVAPSCGDEQALPEPSATATAPAAVAEARQAKQGKLDAFGNLRASGDRFLGFEIPVGSVTTAESETGRTIHVMADERRVVRFYRSRGHVIAETPTGWRFDHTGRTLEGEDPSLGEARAYATRGPGPGWSLRFVDGRPRERPKPALVELIEATRPAAAADPDGTAEPADEANEAARSEPSAAAGDGSAGRRRLEQQALERRLDPRKARDLSRRIYEWSKAHPDRPFAD